jgi:hypothetical protein
MELPLNQNLAYIVNLKVIYKLFQIEMVQLQKSIKID